MSHGFERIHEQPTRLDHVMVKGLHGRSSDFVDYSSVCLVSLSGHYTVSAEMAEKGGSAPRAEVERGQLGSRQRVYEHKIAEMLSTWDWKRFIEAECVDSS